MFFRHLGCRYAAHMQAPTVSPGRSKNSSRRRFAGTVTFFYAVCTGFALRTFRAPDRRGRQGIGAPHFGLQIVMFTKITGKKPIPMSASPSCPPPASAYLAAGSSRWPIGRAIGPSLTCSFAPPKSRLPSSPDSFTPSFGTHTRWWQLSIHPCTMRTKQHQPAVAPFWPS